MATATAKTCPRKKSDMTPCVITDGDICYGYRDALNTNPICVGCGWSPAMTGVPAPKDWDKQVADYERKIKRQENAREREVKRSTRRKHDR